MARELASIAETASAGVRDKIIARLGHDDVERHLLREVDKQAAAEALQAELSLDEDERRIFRVFFIKRGSGYFLMPSISDVARLARGDFDR